RGIPTRRIREGEPGSDLADRVAGRSHGRVGARQGSGRSGRLRRQWIRAEVQPHGVRRLVAPTAIAVTVFLRRQRERPEGAGHAEHVVVRQQVAREAQLREERAVEHLVRGEVTLDVLVLRAYFSVYGAPSAT